MNRQRLLVAAIALLATVPASAAPAPTTAERYHYRITARVRPLLLFWITRSDVGGAVLTRRIAPGETQYSMLIGTDPDRAPLHINRWGYIREEIRGSESQLFGLMTESDEESIEEAQASVQRQSGGRHPFKIIEGSADAGQARSRVRTIAAPEDYTLRHLQLVLALANRDSSPGRARAVALPAGTRPGFLCAMADAIQESTTRSIPYVYFGRLYDLRRTRSARIANVAIGQRSYGQAIAADFVTTSRFDGEQTRFSMTYAGAGALAGVPLRITYQPRWWMQIELTIDEADDAPTVEEGVRR